MAAVRWTAEGGMVSRPSAVPARLLACNAGVWNDYSFDANVQT
jgi:hypothetical protein